MGAVRTFPREGQKKAQTEPPSQVSPAKCRRSRGMLSCVSRAGGGGGQSHRSVTGVWVSPASEARAKLRIFDFLSGMESISAGRVQAITGKEILPSNSQNSSFGDEALL